MDPDDTAYLATLVIFILIGPYFRQIQSENRKKWIGSLISLTIPTFLCNAVLFYPLFLIFVNCLIIKVISHKWCHIVSFVFSSSYLFYFRTLGMRGLPTLNGSTNMILMVAVLKVIGLSFEVHDLSKIKEKERIQISFMDSIHYCLFYAGYLSGPYYSYRVFYEYWLVKDFSNIPCWKATQDALMYIPRNLFFMSVPPYFFPIEFVKSDPFFEASLWERGVHMFVFDLSARYRLDTGFILAETSCISAGLGAFPTATKPRPGFGPTSNFNLMKLGNSRTKLLYDFQAVTTLHALKGELTPTMAGRMKEWNRTVQNWLHEFIFKRLPTKSPIPRILAVFMYSSFWHSLDISIVGNYFLAAWYIISEGIWLEITHYKRARGKAKMILNGIFFISWRAILWFMGGAVYRSGDVGPSLRYYACFHYFFHFYTLALLIIGLFIISKSKNENVTQKKRN